ncbi:hypothetical protein B0H10DRAFT_2003857 [Mycena sp. CBHHK59/15]|nr:hypothetical protein B0H10DRAFT_2003857 [Mycena sp. CBHHK59/15]
MANLRIACLQLGRSTDDLIAPHIVPLDTSPLLDPAAFLPHLEQFEAALLMPGERILSTLPVGLEKLSLTKYPNVRSRPSFSSYLPSASAVFDMLTGVHCPSLKYLELWYKIPTSEEFPSEDLLLTCLPRIFPLLHDLKIHRSVDCIVPKSCWDPVPIFRKLLPEFKHLRTFSLDPDIPDRPDWTALQSMDAKYAHLVKQLRTMAEEMVSIVPWLHEIAMFRLVEMISLSWERWDVIAVPGEKIRLRAHLQDRYPVAVLVILEGPSMTEFE